MKKRQFLLLTTLIGLSMTACGGSKKKDDPKPQPTPSAQTSEPGKPTPSIEPSEPALTPSEQPSSPAVTELSFEPNPTVLPSGGNEVSFQELLKIGEELEGKHPYRAAKAEGFTISNGQRSDRTDFFLWDKEEKTWSVASEDSSPDLILNDSSIYRMLTGCLEANDANTEYTCYVNPYKMYSKNVMNEGLTTIIEAWLYWNNYGCLTHYHVQVHTYGVIGGNTIDRSVEQLYNVSYAQ